MVITKVKDAAALTLKLDGRLDAMTAPQLEEELNKSLEGVTDLTLDFAKLEYISSAGLRVIIIAYGLMHDKGSLKIINANETVQDAFRMTGVNHIIDIG